MNYLIFKITDYLLGIKRNSVSKVVQSMLKVQDNVYSWISGYILIGGKKVHIIDVLFQLGLTMSTYPNGRIHSFILFDYDQSRYGIMIDEIIGEVSASSLNSNSFKTIYGTCNPKLIAGSLCFDNKSVPILNEDFLIPSLEIIKDNYFYSTPTKFFPSYKGQNEGKEFFLNFLNYGKQ